MSRLIGHRRNAVVPGEQRRVPRWRFVLLFVIAGSVYFGVSTLSGDKSAPAHTVIWLLIMTAVAGLLLLWKRLPARVRTEAPSYTRVELIRAISEAFFVFGVVLLPDAIRHGATEKKWIVSAIFLLGMTGAWLLWVVPSERRRTAERDEFQERLSRPYPKAKVR